MKTRKTNTRFMVGNIDVEGTIFDIFVNEYGMNEVVNSGIDFDNAIYSDGFISAIENGWLPKLQLKSSIVKCGEYHHVIIENECYIMNN